MPFIDRSWLTEEQVLPGLSSLCSTTFRSIFNLLITSRLRRVAFATYLSCSVLVSPTARDPPYAPKLTFVAFCTIISGGLISAYGIYVPFLLSGGAIATIGAGLLYTLDIGSPSSHWIGYQALTGIGIGLSLQVPIIANQAFVEVSEISSVTAVTLCKYLVVCALSLTRDPLTNSSFSFPNDGRRHLCLSRPISLHQPTARENSRPRPRRQSCSCGSNGRNRATSSVFSRRTPWHRRCLHGRTEVNIRVGGRIGRSNPAYRAVREMAKRETEGSGCSCVIAKPWIDAGPLFLGFRITDLMSVP